MQKVYIETLCILRLILNKLLQGRWRPVSIFSLNFEDRVQTAQSFKLLAGSGLSAAMSIYLRKEGVK
jgi:hypothetical protein